jgi:hypothetical protein
MKKAKVNGYNPIGSSFNDWLGEELSDKEFRRLFETQLSNLDLGSKLKHLATKRGLSVRSLASKMHTSPSQVQRMFSERASKCSVESLMKFSIVTATKLHEILEPEAA